MIDKDFDKAFFQATFSNFLSEIFEKQLNANKLEMDLVRKCEGKTQSISAHMQIIKLCRISIDNIDNMIKDIREYFNDLKISDLYLLVESIFRIMVYKLKKISECYLRRFEYEKNQFATELNFKSLKVVQQKTQNNQQEIQCICHTKRKEDIRKLERLDFVISGIEMRETELEGQMNYLIRDIQQGKKKIDRVTAVSHQGFFEEIQKIFLEISRKSQSMFNNFHKQIFEDEYNIDYLKPEQFDEQVFMQLKRDIRTVTQKKIKKITEMFNRAFQSRLKQSVIQIQSNIKKEFIRQRQYRLSLNSQKSTKNIKYKSTKSMKKSPLAEQNTVKEPIQTFKKITVQTDRQVFVKQIEKLKANNKELNDQIEILKQNLKIETFQKSRMKNQVIQLENLFKKRTFQLEQSKTSLKLTMQKTARQSSFLAFRKSQLKQKQNRSSKNSHFNNYDNSEDAHQAQQKQVQTDLNMSNLTQFFQSTETFIFEHKPVISLRSKHRKTSNSDDKSRNKYHDTLKSTIQKISQFLFIKPEQTNFNNKEIQQIEQMMKQQKYEAIVQKIKDKLDTIYRESKRYQQQMVRLPTNQRAKKNNQSRKQTKVISTKEKYRKQVQLVQCGVQTDKQKYKQKEAMSGNNKSNQSQSKTMTSSMLTHSRQKNTIITSIRKKSKPNKLATMPASPRTGTSEQLQSQTNPTMCKSSRTSSHFRTQSAQHMYRSNRVFDYKTVRQSVVEESSSSEHQNIKQQQHKIKLLEHALFQQLNFKSDIRASSDNNRNIMLNSRRILMQKFVNNNNNNNMNTSKKQNKMQEISLKSTRESKLFVGCVSENQDPLILLNKKNQFIPVDELAYISSKKVESTQLILIDQQYHQPEQKSTLTGHQLTNRANTNVGGSRQQGSNNFAYLTARDRLTAEL